MEVPYGEPVLLVVTSPASQVLHGCVERHEGPVYEVRLNQGSSAPAENARVVVQFLDRDLPLVQGRVLEVQDERLLVWSEWKTGRDLRDAPRVDARLPLEYCPLPEGIEVTALDVWLHGGESPVGPGDWHRPAPEVNLSASGLRFDEGRDMEVGDLLLVAVTLPVRTRPWRALARVVRVETGPVRTLLERERAWPSPQRIAVHLERLESGAGQALLDFSSDRLRLPGEGVGEAGAN